ncbi:hypothetical protein [Deinococcus yunweiensis]|uniref:hypothetical protein n=1 Tax=Deinococcus yunweiensis TaxID=367282 RepID=UPI00398F0D8D
MPAISNEGVRLRLRQVYNEVIEVRKTFLLIMESIIIMSTYTSVANLASARASDITGKPIEDFKFLKDAADRQSEIYNSDIDYEKSKIVEMHLVYLWGKIDNLIKDILIEHVSIDSPESPLNSENSSLVKILSKIPLSATFFGMSDKEKRIYIIEEIYQKNNESRKQGLGKFEDMLALFELSGPVPRELSDKIFELQNIRNVIAHNSSIADKKFCERCPGLNYKAGQRLVLTHEDFNRHYSAVISYISVITFRFRGEGIPDKVRDVWGE